MQERFRAALSLFVCGSEAKSHTNMIAVANRLSMD